MIAGVINSTNYSQLGLILTWDNSVLEERLKCRGGPYDDTHDYAKACATLLAAKVLPAHACDLSYSRPCEGPKL
jgi:hypothetical protein